MTSSLLMYFIPKIIHAKNDLSVIHNTIDEILQDKKKLVTEIYFEIQNILKVDMVKIQWFFFELGTFFETYAVENDEMHIGKVKEIA